jgi:hypothetical protein
MIPMMVGARLAAAQALLAGRGLRWTVGYTPTGRAPAGTVVSQSRGTGALVAPGSAVRLVVAKAPPPPPAPVPAPTVTAARGNCDPSYPDACLHVGIGDYDCEGGSGNGPNYVAGPIRVRPPDPFGLDRDGDGWGCES